MGDYAAASLTLYGVSGKEKEILAVLESGWGLEWGSGGALRPEDIVEGVELIDTSCPVGWIFEGCGASLAELAITYRFCQEAKYEFDGTIQCFIPGLGTFEAIGSQSSEILVPAKDIEAVLDAAESLEEVHESLGKLTGRTWSAAFAALRARSHNVAESSQG